jgi:hypothetical protein
MGVSFGGTAYGGIWRSLLVYNSIAYYDKNGMPIFRVVTNVSICSDQYLKSSDTLNLHKTIADDLGD